MRSLSATLESAQKAFGSPGGGAPKPPLWKIVLSRTGQTTRGYERTRITKISRTETPTGTRAEIVLLNHDGALTGLDFEHYQAVISFGYNTQIARTAWATGTVYAVDDIVVPITANGFQYRCSVAGTSHAVTEPTWPTTLGTTVADNTVTWEMDGNSGEEYSRCAPLRCRAQEALSSMGILRLTLRAVGILDQLQEDKAVSEHKQTEGDTRTVQTLINAIAGATLSPYIDYTAYTVTYDSTDSLIGTFSPKDFFNIYVNDTRLDKIQELLNYTGCKMRVENDGQIHVFDPVTTGTTYDYEYQFNIAAEHNFWSKSLRNRFVEPNEEIVKSHPEDGTNSGTATSATSFALAPKSHITYRRVASDAEAASIAAAIIERYELEAEKGIIVVPMNVGQELWDFVKITDSRASDTNTGNIQYLRRDVQVHFDNRPLTWTMSVAFGKPSEADILATSQAATTRIGSGEVSTQQLIRLIEELYDYVFFLREQYLKMAEQYEEMFTDLLFVKLFIQDLLDNEGVFKKVTVTEQLIIPVWTD